MTAPTDLIDQLAAFHEAAFSWAVACHAGDAEAGADTLQDAYVKVMAGRAKFAGKSSLKTWWFSVVRLTALERGRGSQRWMRAMRALHDWIAVSMIETVMPEEFGALLDADHLREALTHLPARQAEVLHLAFAQGMSLSEAAAAMGVSVGSARQHYDRAKKLLRGLLAASLTSTACDHAT